MPPSPHATELQRARVLLVEDDDALRRALQLLLVGRGYEVRAYPSAAGLACDPEALRTQCLVADLVLGDSDALDLLTQLRGVGWTGHAVLISGHLTDEWRARALEIGFDAVLGKPIGETVLATVVARLVGSPT